MMWLLITSTHLSLIFDFFTFHTQGKLKYAMPLLTGTLYTCLFLPEAFSLPLPFFFYIVVLVFLQGSGVFRCQEVIPDH